jgi:hypothetical protein
MPSVVRSWCPTSEPLTKSTAKSLEAGRRGRLMRLAHGRFSAAVVEGKISTVIAKEVR